VLDRIKDLLGSGLVTEVVWEPQVSQMQALCLVGCVLTDGGIPVSAFTATTNSGGDVNGMMCPTLFPNLEKRGLVRCDDIARNVLAVAQSVQDNKGTWGEAFRRAVNTHALNIRSAEQITKNPF
jgi:hypothetical protein